MNDTKRYCPSAHRQHKGGDEVSANRRKDSDQTHEVSTTCACCRCSFVDEPSGYAHITPGIEPLAGALFFSYGLCVHCWNRGQSNDDEARYVVESVNRYHMEEQEKPPTKKPKKKRLPAYAQELAQARRRGQAPKRQALGHFVINFDWRQECAPGYPVVTVPGNTDPLDEIDWSFAAGLDALVMHVPSDRFKLTRLVKALHRAGVATIKSFDMQLASSGKKGAYLNWRPNEAIR